MDPAIVLGLVLLPTIPALIGARRSWALLAGFVGVIVATQLDSTIWPLDVFAKRFAAPIRGWDSLLGLIVGLIVLAAGTTIVGRRGLRSWRPARWMTIVAAAGVIAGGSASRISTSDTGIRVPTDLRTSLGRNRSPDRASASPALPRNFSTPSMVAISRIMCSTSGYAVLTGATHRQQTAPSGAGRSTTVTIVMSSSRRDLSRVGMPSLRRPSPTRSGRVKIVYRSLSIEGFWGLTFGPGKPVFRCLGFPIEWQPERVRLFIAHPTARGGHALVVTTSDDAGAISVNYDQDFQNRP